MTSPRDHEHHDVVTATRVAVAHVDAALAVVADVTVRVRERMVSGPSRPLEPHVDGLWASVRARAELDDAVDGPGVVAAVADAWRGRGLTVDGPDEHDGRLRVAARDDAGTDLGLDWHGEVGWLAVTARTRDLPPPDGVTSLLDLDEVFLDAVDPAGDRFRDLG